MSSKSAALADFIASAPPGELSNVIAAIKTLSGDASITSSLEPALRKYNEEQFTTVKLPGASGEVIISPYNRTEDGRYFDVESKSSWDYDHVTQKASDVQSYIPESLHNDKLNSLYKSLGKHVAEHYPSATLGIYPTSNAIQIVTVSSKYSPSNFYNGRLRASYTYTPSTSKLTGTLTVDVHYYEDGNVRLLTKKEVDETVRSEDPSGTIRLLEKKYQEELARGFLALNEGVFKGLRRPLPVTRVKMDWNMISTYKVGANLKR